ncbi:M48 family metallopeptidase [Longimicrobium sp.]|uniref:M48 family metallopeptidase n=1 Tax=Longimicrobium sp. TaxID=2029185 RepID=UPI003B3AB175
MQVLEVGSRRIPYVVRRSARARRQRIVVTPGQVEVIAPESHTDEEIASFVHRRRRWVHDETERMAERTRPDPAAPTRFVTGAKVLYRGRRLRLTVQLADGDAVRVTHHGGIVVEVPRALTDQARNDAAEKGIVAWLRARVREDVEQMVRRHAPRIGVSPGPVRIKAQKHLWGSCGRDGSININWQLVFAPRAVLEYAVVHELCHLKERSHGPDFWTLLGRVMPDFGARKHWLEGNEWSCRWAPAH